MKHLLVVLLSLFGNINANTCENDLHGTCYDLLPGLLGACASDHVYEFKYCGSLQICCYSPNQTVTSTPAISVTEGSNGSHGTCGMSVVGSTSRIVGGSVAQHGEFPWQVSLRIRNQHVCGGTVISDQWILSAAHCFKIMGSNPHEWTVGIGIQSHSYVHPSNIAHVIAIYNHPGFNGKTKVNDIALVKLSKPVGLTGKYVRPACLPRTNDAFESDMCTVSGWGTTHFAGHGYAPLTNQLEYVKLQTIDNRMCSHYLGGYGSVHSTQICAGLDGGKSACQGDSGGPLVCKRHGVWEVAGIASWGVGCGQRNKPGVYTRVTSYLDWIAGIIH